MTGRAFVMSGGAMLDEPITIRDVLTLIHLVRDEHPRDPLRRLEDILFDLAAKAERVSVVS